MKEDSVDISKHTSNHVDEYRHIQFDLILTVCDHAAERCPVFPSTAKRFHYNFPDPGKASGSYNEIMSQFRVVRDQIKAYTQHFVEVNL